MAGTKPSTIPGMLYHWATHEPDTAAFVFVDSATERRRVLTRGDVFRLAGRFAAILRRNDVKSGDVVVNTLPNSPERLISDLGVIAAGAVAMNGQIFLADGEDFLGSLRESSAVSVILDPLERRGAASVLAKLGSFGETETEKPTHVEKPTNGNNDEVLTAGKKHSDKNFTQIHLKELPCLRSIFNCFWETRHGLSFMETLELETESYVDYDVSPDDVAYVWATSGSTGFSKLVPHTHKRVLRFGKYFSFCNGMVDHDEEEEKAKEKEKEGVEDDEKDEEERKKAATPASSEVDVNGFLNRILRATKADNFTANIKATIVNTTKISPTNATTSNNNTSTTQNTTTKVSPTNTTLVTSTKTTTTTKVSTNAINPFSPTAINKTTYSKFVFFNNGRLGWSGGVPGEFLALGATRVLLYLHSGPPSDLARALWRAATGEGCGYAFFLPVHWNMLLERPDLWKGQEFRFKTVGLAGQPVHADLVRRTVGKLADALKIFYGSTEIGQVSCKLVTPSTAHLYTGCNNGEILPGVEVKIVGMKKEEEEEAEEQKKEEGDGGDKGEEKDRCDVQNGWSKEKEKKKEEGEVETEDRKRTTQSQAREERRPAANEADNNQTPNPGKETLALTGELGEVQVRSPSAITEYLGNPEATRKTVLDGGWISTGDVGFLDVTGELHVICRTSFAIMRGAYVIHPGWLEARLRQHPAISDVIIVPVPDPVLHQELCACVVPRPEAEVTESELRAWSEGLFLTGKEDHMTAVPKYFILFPQGFPSTPLGKTCRRSTGAVALARITSSSP